MYAAIRNLGFRLVSRDAEGFRRGARSETVTANDESMTAVIFTELAPLRRLRVAANKGMTKGN